MKEVSLAEVWREVQGCSNWEGLVSPLHPLLQQELVRYGELLSACYKAFELDSSSNRYLNCKYGKKSMFEQLGMEDFGYEVTKYIYATAPDVMTSIPIQQVDSCCGRWIGYVAVASDATAKRLGRRDILVTFRGTVTNQEWVANLMSSLTPARLDPADPRPDVQEQVVVPVTVFSYGGPRVGNIGFKNRCEELGVKVLRIVNVNDPITKLPGVFLNEGLRVWGKYEMPWSCSCYSHVGVEVALDFFNVKNPSLVHDLEAYINSLLSCTSKSSRNDDEGNVVHVRDVFERARGVFSRSRNNVVESFELSGRLGKAASSMVNLFVQSSDQGAEFVTDDNFLGLMNCMALFMFFRVS
ncbi:Galactolipase DONGLE, chloroplastic [Linum grandiflorum]